MTHTLKADGNGGIALAKIIAEAGTVYHETGLTPRQLAEQRSELLQALRAIDADGRDANADGDVTIPSHIWDLVSAALARATDTTTKEEIFYIVLVNSIAIGSFTTFRAACDAADFAQHANPDADVHIEI